MIIFQTEVHSLEVSCVANLTKKIYSFVDDAYPTTSPVPAVQEISVPLYDHECFIEDPINLEENETLSILNPTNNDITSLTLSAQSTLPEFPIVIFQTFPNLTDVQLIYSGIEVLEEDDFLNATQLKRLRLEMNNIDIIGKTAFIKANQLEILRLPSNRIRKIDDYAFGKLKLLKELHLQQNNLTILKERTFWGAVQLCVLYLNDNQINTIEDGALYLEKLERIFLQGNRLKTLSTDLLTGTPALYGIDLSGNQLSSIENVFDKCPNLTVLDLDDNLIQTVDWIELASVPSLTVLSLKNNLLKLDTNADESENDDAEHQKRVAEALNKSRLQYLNLEKNKLYKSDILKQITVFRRLRFLDLDNNAFIIIDEIKNIRQHFPYFVQLNLEDNALSCQWLEDTIPFIKKNKIIFHTGIPSSVRDHKTIDGVACINE